MMQNPFREYRNGQSFLFEAKKVFFCLNKDVEEAEKRVITSLTRVFFWDCLILKNHSYTFWGRPSFNSMTTATTSMSGSMMIVCPSWTTLRRERESFFPGNRVYYNIMSLFNDRFWDRLRFQGDAYWTTHRQNIASHHCVLQSRWWAAEPHRIVALIPFNSSIHRRCYRP